VTGDRSSVGMTATYVVTWAAAPGRKMQRQQYRCSFGAGDLRLELGGIITWQQQKSKISWICGEKTRKKRFDSEEWGAEITILGLAGRLVVRVIGGCDVA
jgi:hypothetical protein